MCDIYEHLKKNVIRFMIQRIYEWMISGWRQWTDVSDISWSGVFSHNCEHFSKYFSKSIKSFFFSVHNWSIFSQLYTLFKEFSALKEFYQNCARPSKKTFCSCFPFLTYERLILPGRNNSRMTFFFRRSNWRLIYWIIWLLPSGRWALGYGGAATVLQ